MSFFNPELTLVVSNTGRRSWPANALSLTYLWHEPSRMGTLVRKEVQIPAGEIPPGGSVPLTFTSEKPRFPGSYDLTLDIEVCLSDGDGPVHVAEMHTLIEIKEPGIVKLPQVTTGASDVPPPPPPPSRSAAVVRFPTDLGKREQWADEAAESFQGLGITSIMPYLVFQGQTIPEIVLTGAGFTQGMTVRFENLGRSQVRTAAMAADTDDIPVTVVSPHRALVKGLVIDPSTARGLYHVMVRAGTGQTLGKPDQYRIISNQGILVFQPDADVLKAEFKVTAPPFPANWKAGSSHALAVTIDNHGALTWPAETIIDYEFESIPYRPEKSKTYGWWRLPAEVSPGGSAAIAGASVTAPTLPGAYWLRIYLNPKIEAVYGNILFPFALYVEVLSEEEYEQRTTKPTPQVGPDATAHKSSMVPAVTAVEGPITQGGTFTVQGRGFGPAPGKVRIVGIDYQPYPYGLAPPVIFRGEPNVEVPLAAGASWSETSIALQLPEQFYTFKPDPQKVRVQIESADGTKSNEFAATFETKTYQAFLPPGRVRIVRCLNDTGSDADNACTTNFPGQSFHGVHKKRGDGSELFGYDEFRTELTGCTFTGYFEVSLAPPRDWNVCVGPDKGVNKCIAAPENGGKLLKMRLLVHAPVDGATAYSGNIWVVCPVGSPVQ